MVMETCQTLKHKDNPKLIFMNNWPQGFFSSERTKWMKTYIMIVGFFKLRIFIPKYPEKYCFHHIFIEVQEKQTGGRIKEQQQTFQVSVLSTKWLDPKFISTWPEKCFYINIDKLELQSVTSIKGSFRWRILPKAAVIRSLYLMAEISPHVDEAHQHLNNIFVPHH